MEIIKNIFSKIFKKMKYTFDKYIINNKKNICKIQIIALMIIIVLIVIYIYIYAAKCTMIQTDDYAHYKQIVHMENYIENDDLHNAIEYAKWDCVNLGGRYFTMFIQCFFGIKKNIDYIKNHMLIMKFNVFFYFITLYFCIFSFFYNLIMHKRDIIDIILLSLFCYLSFIISFNCFNYYPEIFNWFPGAASYTIPLSCFFIAIGSSLFLLNYKNIMLIIISFIFGIFCMGGSLCIVSTGCTIIFIILFFCIINKKINISFIIISFHNLIYGIINLISPGNFNRRLIERGTSFSIVSTVNTCFEYINGRCLNLFRFPFQMLVILLLGGIVAFLIMKYSKFNYLSLLTIPLLFCLPIATTLPIVVGVGRFELYIKEIGIYDRLVFPIDFSLLTLIFVCTVLCYIAISYIINKRQIAKTALMLTAICISIYICRYRKEFSISDIHILEMSDNIIQHKYDDIYNEYLKMMLTLEENRGKENVIVETPKPLYSHFYNYKHRGDENEFFEIKNIVFK